MKILSITIIGVVFLSTGVSAQLRPGDIGYNPAIEKIYSDLGIRKIYTYQTNPEYGSEEFLYSISLVDVNGRLTEEKLPSAEAYFSTDDEGYGDDTTHYFYKYTSGNQVQQITALDYSLNTVETYFVYNDQRQLAEKTIGSADARRYKYEYDDKGKVIKANGQAPVYTSGEQGTPIDIQGWEDIDYYIYTYNDKNLLAESKYYFKGKLQFIVRFTYDGTWLNGFKTFADERAKTPDRVNMITYNLNGTPDRMTVVSNLENTRVTYRYSYSGN